MGVFYELLVTCTKCGTDVTFQSKSGPCLLSTYSIHDIPQSVLSGIVGDSMRCVCGYIVSIRYDYEERVNAWDYVQ